MLMVIAIGNNKGGVAKTRTVITFGAALVRRGAKVLIIDFDGQRNATTSVLGNFEETDDAKTVMTWMAGSSSFDETIFGDVEGWGFDLMPGSVSLDDFDVQFKPLGREFILKQAIESANLRNLYDVIIIDTAPAFGSTLYNALIASDELLVVSTVNNESITGANKVIGASKTIREIYNPDLKIDGVLFTMVQTRYKSGRECLEASRSILFQAADTYDTIIRHSIAVGRMSWGHSDICVAEPKNNVAVDYEKFADEWVSRHHPDFYKEPDEGELSEGTPDSENAEPDVLDENTLEYEPLVAQPQVAVTEPQDQTDVTDEQNADTTPEHISPESAPTQSDLLSKMFSN